MSERLHAIALASQSPRRLQLLRGLGLEVTVIRSGFAEEARALEGDPATLAVDLAIGKVRAAEAHGPHIVVGADTIVAVDRTMLGKPQDDGDAVRMLRLLSGREHTVYTGLAVVDRRSGAEYAGVESTRVHFLPLSDAQIAGYVSSGDADDKAGAYGIQGRGALMVRSIMGDFYTVMGLPLARLGEALSSFGYDLLAG
ncbi:MAG: Maf family protein [Candidatus Eremiobacteraeota bacterium]|nr:Maf family protein [Candidatus Eremiobacteraeota bacterium]